MISHNYSYRKTAQLKGNMIKMLSIVHVGGDLKLWRQNSYTVKLGC